MVTENQPPNAGKRSDADVTKQVKFITAPEFAAILRLSKPSFDRFVSQAYAGTSDMPLPLLGKGKKRIWSLQSIENWIANKQSQTRDPPTKAESAAARAKRHRAALKNLKEQGIKIAEPSSLKQQK
jgi:predicted DNA-binding transcriptional regulator AlpA